MQLVISRSGVPVHFGITAANVHGVNYLQWMNETQLTDCELIADKGYLSLGCQTSLFEYSGESTPPVPDESTPVKMPIICAAAPLGFQS